LLLLPTQILDPAAELPTLIRLRHRHRHLRHLRQLAGSKKASKAARTCATRVLLATTVRRRLPSARSIGSQAVSADPITTGAMLRPATVRRYTYVVCVEHIRLRVALLVQVRCHVVLAGD